MHFVVTSLRFTFFFYLLSTLFGSIVAYSQSGTMEGVVLDEDTQQPIPFATVFLSSTTHGVSASENGTFVLAGVPGGKYDVIVSSVGYKSRSQPIEFTGTTFKVIFTLKQAAVELGAIVVEAGSKKHYGTFIKYFLGTTKNATDCEILNPDAINLRYEEKTKVLSAAASEPIEIENRALGYRVFYQLHEFVLDETNKTFRVFGTPRFEVMEPEDSKQLRQWNRARDVAYFGSLNHFMRSLAKRQLRKNDFSIFRQGVNVALNEKSLFKDSTSNEIRFQGSMEVIFNGERESQDYVKKFVPGIQRAIAQPFQTSLLTFTEPKLTIYPNGYYENRKSLMLDGYLAWGEVVADLLPLDYEPTTRK